MTSLSIAPGYRGGGGRRPSGAATSTAKRQRGFTHLRTPACQARHRLNNPRRPAVPLYRSTTPALEGKRQHDQRINSPPPAPPPPYRRGGGGRGGTRRRADRVRIRRRFLGFLGHSGRRERQRR